MAKMGRVSWPIVLTKFTVIPWFWYLWPLNSGISSWSHNGSFINLFTTLLCLFIYLPQWWLPGVPNVMQKVCFFWGAWYDNWWSMRIVSPTKGGDHKCPSNLYCWSHHYAELGNALQKLFSAYSALIMGTLWGSIGQFFNFSAQNQDFTEDSNGPDLP